MKCIFDKSNDLRLILDLIQSFVVDIIKYDIRFVDAIRI